MSGGNPTPRHLGVLPLWPAVGPISAASGSLLPLKLPSNAVFYADLQEDSLNKLAAQLGGPEIAATRRCDVREERDVQVLVGAAEEAFGRPLDIMVSSAGEPTR